MQKAKLASAVLCAVLIGQAACGGQLSGPSEAPPGAKSKPQFKPGFNLFSPAQDVQMGQQSAQQVLQETPMLDDPQITNYIRQPAFAAALRRLLA